MTCRELVEFLSAYLDGQLSAAQHIEFDAHLAVCPECAIYVRTYAETVKLGKAAFRDPGAPVPEDVPPDLVRAILAARMRS